MLFLNMGGLIEERKKRSRGTGDCNREKKGLDCGRQGIARSRTVEICIAEKALDTAVL